MKPVLFLASFMVGAMLPRADYKPLELREVVDVVADYSIHHVQMPTQTPFYGMTDPDARTIWMVEAADLAERRRIAIHELAHVTLRLRGDLRATDEDYVHEVEEQEYTRLYGQ